MSRNNIAIPNSDQEYRISTNHGWRPTLGWDELTKVEQGYHDYLDTEEAIEGAVFVRYKKHVYYLNDYMATAVGDVLEQAGWQGYETDSYSSGTLIKYHPRDQEYVCIARYYIAQKEGT